MVEQTNTLEVETKPLVSWKNPPSLQQLKQDLLEASPVHDAQETKITTWLDNLNVTGSALVNPPKGNSRIVPKLIRKQAEWRYAALSEPFLSTDDLFNVRPVTWEDKDAAAQNELVLSHQFNSQIDKVSFIDEYVRTLVDEGTAIIRVGWDFQEEEYEAQVPKVEFVINPALAPLHKYLAQMKVRSPSEYATDVPEELKLAHEMSIEQGQPIEPRIIGYTTETKMRTVKNQPTLEICDYHNVIIDPTCQGNIDKAQFVIYRFESSKSELEKDGKYKNLDKINIEANSILGTPDHVSNEGSKNFNFSDQPRKKFVVHEYWGFWDIDGSGIVKPFVAAWVGDTLVRMEEAPFPDKKLPFVVVQYLPVRKSIYGEPDGALLEDNQKILGAVTRGMIDLMGKSANSQTGVRKDMLDTTNRRRFEKGLDYEFNANVDPRQGVYQHTFPEIPASAQFMMQLMNMEAEALTGVKAYSQGISAQALGDVAAAVRGALDAASKRELGILRRLSKGVTDIGRKIISMNSEFLSDEEVIRITNEDFVTVRRDDLAGNFDLRLSISTAEEDNNKAQELAFMLQTMGNNMEGEMSRMLLAEIAKLRKMPHLAQMIKEFQPQPDPLMKRQMELDIQLKEIELAERQAKIQNLMASAQLDQAKVGTELAKQGNLKSDTDIKNLDFVEQESGVKQERDLQKQRAQAEAQTQMKLIDHSLKQQQDDRNVLRDYLLNRN